MKGKTTRQQGGRGDARGNSVRGPATASRRLSARALREAVVSLDAEDIALARLQADLRRTEAIRIPTRHPAPLTRRTTVRLHAALLARLRERAKRDGITASEVVEQALERFLRSR